MPDKGRQTCPNCKTTRLLIRGSSVLSEKLIFAITGRRKYLCQLCGYEFRALGPKPTPRETFSIRDVFKERPSPREEEIVEEFYAPPAALILTSAPFGLLALGLLVGGALWFYGSRSAPVATSTPYQVVLLKNGSAYFGHLEGLGTPYPVLRDVFYVQSAQNPKTKQVSNVLVRRGKEWHAPDRMVLNAEMIVVVEPVSPSSLVAKLIAEAKNK